MQSEQQQRQTHCHSSTSTICQCYYISYKYKNPSLLSASHFTHYRYSSLHGGFCCHLQASLALAWLSHCDGHITERPSSIDRDNSPRSILKLSVCLFVCLFFWQNKATAQFRVGTASWRFWEPWVLISSDTDSVDVSIGTAQHSQLSYSLIDKLVTC
jgi:hypothetical protein